MKNEKTNNNVNDNKQHYKRKSLIRITESAVLIALLVAAQFVFSSIIPEPTVKQLITGSAVNLILIMAVIMSGRISGVAVAAVSPFFAFLFKIGTTYIQIVPFIALGNIVFVLAWYYIAEYKNNCTVNSISFYIRYIAAAVVAAGLKFLVLWLSISKFALPVMLSDVTGKALKVISATFSYMQIFTALIGGALAIAIIPVIRRIRGK